MGSIRRREFLVGLGTGALGSRASCESVAGRNSRPGEALEGSSGDPRIEVRLDRIAWNFSQIKKRVKVPIMAVVKANAYGHGLVEVSRALQEAGAGGLMVGKLQEALALREAGIHCPVLNFGPFGKPDCPEIVRRNISQSVSTEEAAYLDEAAAKLGKKASLHVDVNTGMNRTGVSSTAALGLIEKIASYPHAEIQGICTTLTEDPDFDREQLRRFLDVCSSAKKRGISVGLRHAASSAAISASPEFYLDMVRPGIALYGYYANSLDQKEDALSLKPALSLAATIVFIKDISAGETLSYRRALKAPKDTRVATAGIGYSDGYPTQLGGKGWAGFGKKRAAVLNAVTANHTMLDLGADREIRVGDEVTLIDPEPGSGLTADALEEQSGLSAYKILIGLNPLLRRVYSG